VTQPNVPEKCSVEYFAQRIRKMSNDTMYPYAFGLATGYADLPTPPADALKRIANIAAAVKVVNEERRAAFEASFNYSRTDSEPGDPTPVSPARAPLHVGVVDDGGLVDMTLSKPEVPDHNFLPSDPGAPEHGICARPGCNQRWGQHPALPVHAGPCGSNCSHVTHRPAAEHNPTCMGEPPVHYLEPGSSGENSDRVACGELVIDSGLFTSLPVRTTCKSCLDALCGMPF
jgi:hypothetical protein